MGGLAPYSDDDGGDLHASALQSLRDKCLIKRLILIMHGAISVCFLIGAAVQVTKVGFQGTDATVATVTCLVVLPSISYFFWYMIKRDAKVDFSCPHCSAINTYDASGWRCDTCTTENSGLSFERGLNAPFVGCINSSCSAPDPTALKCYHCHKLIMIRPKQYFTLNLRSKPGVAGVIGVARKVGDEVHPTIDKPEPSTSSRHDPGNIFNDID